MNDAIGIYQLLDIERVEELNRFLALSCLAPQRFVAWTELHKLLVILDLKDGAVTRARYGEATREQAEAAIAELTGGLH